MIMRYIDLHVHSNCSDGTFSPEELVVLGIKQELVAFALTDHDTISGVERAIKKAEEFLLRFYVTTLFYSYFLFWFYTVFYITL